MNLGRVYSTIDTHVAGEAFRIVTQSSIVLNKNSIHENNVLLQRDFREEKSILLKEPRGHRDMHGCIVIPSLKADFGLLFFNHDQQVQFKLSGLVATLTALLETGHLKQKDTQQYTAETIHGIFQLKVKVVDQEVVGVSVSCGKCLVQDEDNYQRITVASDRDYLLFELPESIPTIHLKYLSDINEWGREAVNYFSQDESLAGIILLEGDSSKKGYVRSLTYERDGTVLRSPGYDSTFVILSALHQKDSTLIEVNNTSIFNSHLIATLNDNQNELTIEAEAFITGFHEFLLDPEDPLYDGFLLK